MSGQFKLKETLKGEVLVRLSTSTKDTDVRVKVYFHVMKEELEHQVFLLLTEEK